MKACVDENVVVELPVLLTANYNSESKSRV